MYRILLSVSLMQRGDQRLVLRDPRFLVLPHVLHVRAQGLRLLAESGEIREPKERHHGRALAGRSLGRRFGRFRWPAKTKRQINAALAWGGRAPVAAESKVRFARIAPGIAPRHQCQVVTVADSKT